MDETKRNCPHYIRNVHDRGDDSLCTNFSCEVSALPRWIPVTERLPNENDDVLIYGEWTGASGTKYREIWLTDLKGFLHQGYKPIAWMPIPTPPKEETE